MVTLYWHNEQLWGANYADNYNYQVGLLVHNPTTGNYAFMRNNGPTTRTELKTLDEARRYAEVLHRLST